MSKTLQSFIVFILTVNSFLNVSCQTKEEKVASALKQCQTLLDKDDLDKATTCYADAMLANPDDYAEISQKGKKAFFKKCVEYKNNDSFEKAIVCFEGYTTVDKNFADAYFLLAASYLQFYEKYPKNNNDDLLTHAEDSIMAGLKINPEDASAHVLYAEILTEKNKLQEALTEYTRAVKLDTTKGIYFVKMAIVQEQLGQDEATINSYKKALAINSNDDVALWFLGLFYERKQRCTEAIEAITKANKADPDNQETLEKLADLKKNCELNNQPKKKAKVVGENENGGSGIVVKP